jgi:choline dehydrogenase-like flavoprotein
LLERYSGAKAELNRSRVWLGRTRSATARDDFDGRKGCTYLGRCLWGCPRESLYTPSITLRELARRDGFTYVPGRYVTHFELDGASRVSAVEALELASGARERIACERLVLAAGTLASSKVFLDSTARAAGSAPVLRGLMDNRQVLLPFVNLDMLLRKHDPRTYQYHQLALGLERSVAKHYVHGLITTLKTALIHPIVQSVPFDLRSALYVFKNSHAALGILNVNFHDERRDENVLALERDGERSRLSIAYSPSRDEPARLGEVLGTLRRALRKLRCFVPPGMAHVRPMGGSVHYAGTLPMSRARAPLTTSAACESHDYAGLYFVDGTTLPFLPAKNLTFTLMANARRVAARAF